MLSVMDMILRVFLELSPVVGCVATYLYLVKIRIGPEQMQSDDLGYTGQCLIEVFGLNSCL